ncbi:MAG TPA: ATP-binding protein [Ohtaekwangia sp.]
MESTEGITNQTALVMGTAMMLFLTTAIVMFIYLFQRKLIKRKMAYQEIENLLKRQELKSAYALLEGQDMERQRIAEEIHDNLGSILVTLDLYTHAFERSSSPEEKRELTTKIREMTQRATVEARKISHRMDAGALRHFGLQAAIRDVADAVNDLGNVSVITTVELTGTLKNEISLNLYRILQELINNTLKHAQAKTITLEITQVNEEYVSFIYEDDGIGMKTDKPESAGMGLRNIAARVEKLQGTISMANKPVHGFSVVIEMPLS